MSYCVVDDFRRYLLALGRSAATVACRVGGLRRFLAFLETRHRPWHHVRLGDVEWYRAGLVGAGHTPNTIDTSLRAVKRFYDWCIRTERLAAHPMAGFRFARIPRALPRDVPTRREMRRLLAAPDAGTPVGLRDRAILELLYSSGLRLSELCRLDIHHLDFGSGLVRVVAGKGAKDRVVPVGRTAVASLRGYLLGARPGMVNRDGDTLFPGTRGRRISGQTVERIVRDHARSARIAKRLTPHSIRHAFATHLLQCGADVVHVQRMLGHACLTTTQIYLQVAIGDLKATHTRTHPRARVAG